VPPQRPLAVDVDEVQDESARLAQRGRSRLREEQRHLEIGAEQVVPVRRRDLADRRRIEGRGVVDEHVEPTEGAERGVDEPRQVGDVEQVGLDADRRVRALRIQLADERLRLGCRSAVVQGDVGARGVQRAGDLGPHAPCRAGDQYCLARECAHAG
jgi:hypothetical protein